MTPLREVRGIKSLDQSDAVGNSEMASEYLNAGTGS